MKKFISTITFVIAVTFCAHSQSSYLVPVGGGPTNDEITKKIISLAKVAKPNVLIISNASQDKDIPKTIKKSSELFSKFGITNINGLDVNKVEEAKKLIANADIIWMSGGKQGKLIKDLSAKKLEIEIQKRFKAGNVVISGTSAGASILSDIMMTGTAVNEETKEKTAKLSRGLKLWPETILDQHFSERDRLGRLKTAVAAHPKLLGIGIDESTAVIYNGQQKITVLGTGTVSFVKKSSNADSFEVVVLKNLDEYTIK
jgi:cyanophycinase